MEFKDRFKYLIENVTVNKKKVTAYRLGKETSISRVSAENYLFGKQKPSIEKATIIAQYFGVSVNWLLTGEDEIKKELDNQINSEMVPISLLNKIVAQNDELLAQHKILIETINSQAELLKKTNVRQGDDVICADVSGSDLVE